MIELRWVRLKGHAGPDDPEKYVAALEGRYRKLQYREQTNLPQEGLQERIWSEWKDVLIVDEEK